MSTERMSDLSFALVADGIEDNEAPDSAPAVMLREARRARSEEAKCDAEVRRLREENASLWLSLRAANALHRMTDAALDEFASHHPREDGRQRTVSECVQEAMDTLRGRIASLEAERSRLRQAVGIEKARGEEYLKTIEQLREEIARLRGEMTW